MGVNVLVLGLLLIATPAAVAEPTRICVEPDGAAACLYSEPQGVAHSTGASVTAADGTFVKVHDDEFDGWSGRSRVIMAEAGDGWTNVYWGTGWTDYDGDGLPDDVCVVCGGVWNPYDGYLVSQYAALTPQGVQVVAAVSHDGMLRGVDAGVDRGEPYVRVVLV